MFYKILGLLLISLFSACTSYPEPINVSQERNLIRFKDITADSIGSYVRWGGVVSDLRKVDGVVLATVTQYPLLHSGQPTYVAGSGGLFIAEFADLALAKRVKHGDVLTLVGTVEELQNPHPALLSTQMVIVQTENLYVWEGFSRATNPTLEIAHPSTPKRGKWGWQIKSEKDKKRERQEAENQRRAGY